MMRRASLVALFLAVLTIAVPARAQSSGRPQQKATPRKVIHLEEMKVEGRIQKPQAMFLMPRANLNYGDLDHSESFLSKVKRAVEKPPF